MTGLLLAGDGKGNFTARTSKETGFNADRSVKGMSAITLGDGSGLLLVANNNSSMQAYRVNQRSSRRIALERGEEYAVMTTPAGGKFKQEFYRGSGYLSQSSRIVDLPKGVNEATIFSAGKKSRTIHFNN